MATGLRHLKLSINYKIVTFKSNCFKSSLNKTDADSSKRTTWSCCKVIQVENVREIKTGTPASLIKYQPANCALQVRCMSLINTSPIEEIQKNWVADNSSFNYLNYEEERQQHLPAIVWFQPVNQTSSWPVPVVHLPHTYDSFNLPMKMYHRSMDDICIRNGENSFPVEILMHKTQFPVFSGYLESSPYYMYCHGMKEHSSLTLSDFEHHFVSTAHVAKNNTYSELPGKPSEEQLKNVYLRLSDSLPKFFVRPLDYSIFHKDIVFQNNIRGVTTNGIAAYVQQMALVRILGHLRYAHIKLEILKITQHVEDGTVRVRWRITGISGFRALFLFWKFKLWEWKKMIEKEREWIDGFSIFSVGSDGLVYKHVCDKMMPDEEKVDAKRSDVAVKFALILGLIPRPYECGVNLLNSNSFAQQGLPCNQP